MLVYGDHSETADQRRSLEDIDAEIRRIRCMAAGIDRHAALVGALIRGGQLLQGVADAEFDTTRVDRRTAAADALTHWLQRLAKAVCRSWDGGFAAELSLPFAPHVETLPDRVELKTPEGFAFYALYPEAYIEAARKLTLCSPPQVIGIRSIGTTLAAAVAAALDASSFITVRPFGNPFARSIVLEPEIERELLGGHFHYVIVDEGPGESGSSFGAVADWLQERGVALDRNAFFFPPPRRRAGPRGRGGH